MQTNESLGRQAYLNILKRSWIGIPILIIVLALQILLFQNLSRQGAERLQDLGENEISILSYMIESAFEEYYSTLNLVLHAEEFTDHLGSGSCEDRDAAAMMFQRVSLNTRDVRGLRYIDASGLERIRIESSDREADIIGLDELGDKSGSECVAASLGLEEGEIFYSTLVYLMNDGIRVEPDEFVLKMSVPVFHEGEDRGFVMISFAADRILDIFDTYLAQVSPELSFGLIDSEGRWLIRQEGGSFEILIEQEEIMLTGSPGGLELSQDLIHSTVQDLDDTRYLMHKVDPLVDLAEAGSLSQWFVICAFSTSPSLPMRLLPVMVYLFFILLFVLWIDRNRRSYLHDNDRQLLRVTSEVADHTYDGVVITDRDTKVQFVNRSFGRIFGFEPEDLEGTDLIDLVQGEADQKSADAAAVGSYEPLWIRTSSGDSSLSYVSISGALDRYEQESSHLICLFHQVQASELSLESLVLDAGRTVSEAADSYPARCIESQLGEGPVMCLVLRMPEVEHLQTLELFFMLSRETPLTTPLFRYSYDRILIPVHERDLEKLLSGIGSIEEEISESIGDHIHFFCGISQLIREPDGIPEALSQARVASFIAHAEEQPVRYFSQKEIERLKRRYRFRSIFPKALETGELFLVFQPQVRTDTHEIIGAEALIRWDHPEEGAVPPDEFIPAIEGDRELMHLLCCFIVENTLSMIRGMIDDGLLGDSERFKVSVNLTTGDILDRSLIANLEERFARVGVPAHRIGIEITERTVMKNFDVINEVFSRLRGAGMEISIDDFGTGFSSLSYLQKLNIDTIKIDRSFIRDVPDVDDGVLVDTLTSMAHRLGISVICEGVETDSQKRFLRSVGCESYQGYLFSRPLEAESFLRLFGQGQGVEQ